MRPHSRIASILFVLVSALPLVAADKQGGVSVVSLSPSGDVALAGGSGGIFRSTDGGASWKLALRGGSDFIVASIAFDPASADVYAATSRGLFRSPDGGSEWETKDLLGGSTPGRIVFDPERKGTLYVSTADGLYVSSDRGATWTGRNPNGSTFSVRGLAARQKPFTIYLVNEEGLFASKDRGATWQALSDERDDLMAVAAEGSSTLHVATNGTRYLRSADDGRTWQTQTISATFGDFFTIGDRVFATAGDTTWSSSDSGKSWSEFRAGDDPKLRSVTIDPKKRDVLWATSSGDVVLMSKDGGKSWAASSPARASSR